MIMRLEVKLISFDAWNTLLKLDLIGELISEKLSELCGLDPKTIYELMVKVHEEVKARWILGEVRNSDFLREAQSTLAKELKTSSKLVRKAVAEAFRALSPEEAFYPGVLETLEDLSKDFHLAVISNVSYWPGKFTRAVFERAGVSKFFRVQLYADEVGASKPDRRIFSLLCRVCRVGTRNVIHVGDSVLEDVGGALSSGMKAVLIRKDLKSLKLVEEVGLAVIPDLSHLRQLIPLV